MRWLLRLGLSAVAAFILGVVGFQIADAGFLRKEQISIAYTNTGEMIKSSTAKFSFYGITLLKSDNLNSIGDESNRVALIIVVSFAGAGGLIGFVGAFFSLRFLTRPKAERDAGAGPVRWLVRLGFSAVAALILGAIGFAIANNGLHRKVSEQTAYSSYGTTTSRTGSATLSFYGIRLLKTNNLYEFDEESEQIGKLILASAAGLCNLFGFSLAFQSLAWLTRTKGIARSA